MTKRFFAVLALSAVLSGGFVLASQEAPVQHGGFAFKEGRSQTISVPIHEADGAGGIVWPAAANERWDTALLQVRVTVDAAASGPFVEIDASGVSDRQYFAAGDSGERWLNLSF